MDPRIALEHLVRRLEPKVGNPSRGDFSRWLDDQADGEPLRDENRRGRMHLARAVYEARRALRSGDAATMARAAIYCAGLERTGMELGEREAGREASSHRRAGGKKRGEAQRTAAEKLWAPYVELYRRKLAEGVSPETALATVSRKITRDGFVLPSTGNAPTQRSIRENLRKK